MALPVHQGAYRVSPGRPVLASQTLWKLSAARVVLVLGVSLLVCLAIGALTHLGEGVLALIYGCIFVLGPLFLVLFYVLFASNLGRSTFMHVPWLRIDVCDGSIAVHGPPTMEPLGRTDDGSLVILHANVLLQRGAVAGLRLDFGGRRPALFVANRDVQLAPWAGQPVVPVNDDVFRAISAATYASLSSFARPL